MKSLDRLKMASALVQRLRDAIQGNDPAFGRVDKDIALGGGVGGGLGALAELPGYFQQKGFTHGLEAAGEYASQPAGQYVRNAADPILAKYLQELAGNSEARLLERLGQGGLMGAGLGIGGLGLYRMLHHKGASERPITRAEIVADSFIKEAIIRQEGEGYTLVSHKGKVLGKHPSRAKAIAQEQAIKAHGG